MATNSTNMKYWQDDPAKGDAPRAADAHLTAEETEALNRLYPTSAKPATQTVDPNATAASRLYGTLGLEQVIDRNESDLFVHAGRGAADHRQLRQTFVNFVKAGVPDGIARELAEKFIDGEIGAARRPAAEIDTAADALEQQITAWHAETREYLRLQYGAQAAEDLLERTRKYVASVPGLGAVLDKHGVGSRPDVVKQLVHHVFITGYR